jgi:hypothetical protein
LAKLYSLITGDRSLSKPVNLNISRRSALVHSTQLLGGALLASRTLMAGQWDKLIFSCSADNDLFQVLGTPERRYDTPAQAIENASAGAGVLILADGYPVAPTQMNQSLVDRARQKQLRLYIEFPSWLPDLQIGPPQHTTWERAVVASEVFGPALAPMRILAISDCHYVPVENRKADIVVARVAGFDTAVYGLPASGVYSILFEHSNEGILVATTKLSQFLTARYGPSEAWIPVWKRVLTWLCSNQKNPDLKWTPSVRPSFVHDASLSANAGMVAFRRGIQWYENARLLVHPSWKQEEKKAVAGDKDRIWQAPQLNWPSGDGSLGLLEGFNAAIKWDGSQRVRWWLRADCIGESSLAMALSASLDKNKRRRTIAANLNDFIYRYSSLSQGSRADPHSASFGLLDWNTSDRGVYYGDDNARSMLGTIGAAALLSSDRWDEMLLRCILANLRTTGPLGFRSSRINEDMLQKNGWRYYFEQERVNYAPHFEAYLWAIFLWAYDKTRYAPFLNQAKSGIQRTLAAYPADWHWTNGIQQERARMLLPLAWLVRVQDKPEHRDWLQHMSKELLAFQDECGAIREEVGRPGKSSYGPPKSNSEYGTKEAPLIQKNGDPLADLLYTTNFAFLGLHEAAAATGERRYTEASDKLAKFLCRIQVRSERHPELDGAWFRAFDFHRWEYWASNADAGWGAWSIETGWTQAWITTVLGMRSKNVSLWGLTAESKIGKHKDPLTKEMFPDA